MFDTPVYKILAHNDTGAASGHQGGFVIPKAIEDFFPDVLGSTTPASPTVDVPIHARLLLNGIFQAQVVARYQYQSWGGTRFERRLTSNLGPIRNLAVADDIALFSRDLDSPDIFEINLLKGGTQEHSSIISSVGTRRWGSVPGLPMPVSNRDIELAAARINDKAAHDFLLFDETRPTLEKPNKRKARTAAFRKRLIAAYGENCMATSESIRTPNGGTNLDAAHIVPIEDGGSDDPRNGLLISKDLHWAFDNGLFGIADNLEIVVPPSAIANDSNLPLCRLLGASIQTFEASIRPHEEALAWHRANKLVH